MEPYRWVWTTIMFTLLSIAISGFVLNAKPPRNFGPDIIQDFADTYNSDPRPRCACGIEDFQTPITDGGDTHPHERSPRLVGGQRAPIGKYPFLVNIRVSYLNNGSSLACGGSMITELHVLTAAHCLVNFHNPRYTYRAVVSREKLWPETDNGFDSHPRIIAKEAMPTFNISSWFEDDLAIVTLDKAPIEMEPTDLGHAGLEIDQQSEASSRNDTGSKERVTVSAICLPPFGSDVPPGILAFAAGWGAVKYGGPMSRHLKDVALPVKNRTDCLLINDVTDSMICAGGRENEDACQGDSGGPMIIRRGATAIQVGLVSFGEKCGYKNTPALYTRVGALGEFIYEQTRSHATCKPNFVDSSVYDEAIKFSPLADDTT